MLGRNPIQHPLPNVKTLLHSGYARAVLTKETVAGMARISTAPTTSLTLPILLAAQLRSPAVALAELAHRLIPSGYRRSCWR